MFWVRSDLESRKKVRVFNFWGGVLGKVGLGLWEEFHFQSVECVLEPNPRTEGILENLVKNFWKLSLMVHHR